MSKYKPTPLKIENTGHYVEVPYDPTSYLYVGSQPTDVYQLEHFHFHAPSEHTINGVRYDAELHLVHTNVIGETAVIGVLLSSSAKGLPIFDTIMALSPTSIGETELSEEVNVFDLLPFRKGFYRYEAGARTPIPDTDVESLIVAASRRLGVTRRTIDKKEIVERLIFPMINEGARILDEKIAQRPGDIDVIWVYGYGFPIWRGGPMFYADSVGLAFIRDQLTALARHSNDKRHEPAALLAKLAAAGETFGSLGAKASA